MWESERRRERDRERVCDLKFWENIWRGDCVSFFYRESSSISIKKKRKEKERKKDRKKKNTTCVSFLPCVKSISFFLM
jgi:hypothetical protein